MEQCLSGEVANKKGAGTALSTECPSAELAVVVAVESNTHVLHVDQGSAGLATHDLDGVLVAQVVAAFDRVVGMVFPVVAAIQQGGVDPALGSIGVTAHRMHLADDGGV